MMMKYKVRTTNKYDKQEKLLEKRGYDMALLKAVVGLIARGRTLPAKYNDHALKGNRIGFRDCHIKDDWVLIYRIDKGELVLLLFETGTHADLLD
jgi:mRNA interferase YafQ